MLKGVEDVSWKATTGPMIGKDGGGLGLALGGGAARGLAHVGVLRVLAEHRVPVTHLAGCSAGSVVAAAYLCGTLDELESFVGKLGRMDLARFADITFAGGMLGGERVLEVLQALTRGLRFEDLPLPFAVVAADLNDRTRVVLRSGPLAEALHAAVAVPGLMAPVPWNGRLLADGGLVELLPVRTARELGAGPVVAVDVSSPDIWTRAATGTRLSVQRVRRGWSAGYGKAAGHIPEQARNLTKRLVPRSLSGWNLVRTVLTAFEVTDARLRTEQPGGEPDLLIRPDVAAFHGHQFYRAAEIIEAGRVAAEAAIPLITRLPSATPGASLPPGAAPAVTRLLRP